MNPAADFSQAAADSLLAADRLLKEAEALGFGPARLEPDPREAGPYWYAYNDVAFESGDTREEAARALLAASYRKAIEQMGWSLRRTKAGLAAARGYLAYTAGYDLSNFDEQSAGSIRLQALRELFEKVKEHRA